VRRHVTSIALPVAAALLGFACGADGESDVGGVELPAFVDHHAHVFNVGWTLLQQERRPPSHVFAGGARSESEVAERVAASAADTTTGWITGAGWNQEAWGTSVLPGLDTLSARVPRRPVALVRSDAHALWLNRAALAAADLRDRGAGVLIERDVEPVAARIPVPSDADIIEAWRRGADAMAARGVTRVYDAGVLALPGVVALNADFGRYVRLLAEADRVRPLPITIHLMIPAPSAYADSVLVMPPPSRELSPNVRITHLKLFADGALGSRGAALSHPYADDGTTHGVLRMRAGEIGALARRALDAGLDVATHAIGDRAVTEVLDAYEGVLSERPDLEPARLRIEHFSYASETDMERAARLGVALSIQSNFNSARGTTPTFGEQRVGVEGADRVYAWDRLDALGALLVEGTDHFGAPSAPLAGVHAALTGFNAIGQRGDTPEVRERVLRMHQVWLAPGGRLVMPESGRGPLVRLSGDPRRVPVDSLLSVVLIPGVRER
jgi:predicted amidohydrolase YtcJ